MREGGRGGERGREGERRGGGKGKDFRFPVCDFGFSVFRFSAWRFGLVFGVWKLGCFATTKNKLY